MVAYDHLMHLSRIKKKSLKETVKEAIMEYIRRHEKEIMTDSLFKIIGYLDTGFFIALSDARDKNHTRAKMYLKKQVQSGARFVTGRNVVVEYIDGVTKRVSKIKAIEELENILSSRLTLRIV